MLRELLELNPSFPASMNDPLQRRQLADESIASAPEINN